MEIWDVNIWHWLVLLQHELFLFAAIFYLVGATDDIALDLVWIGARLNGKAKTRRISRAEYINRPLQGMAAIFIPAWQEDRVIGSTITHILQSWGQADLRLYIGCYRNDPATIAAVMQAGSYDPRVRVVIHDRDGPTTKADCLNRLYQALCDDEARSGRSARMVVFHDAEDLVDPAALAILDQAVGDAQFVQLPVQALPQRHSRWLGSHYCEEFAEAHGKSMVVRDLLGAAVPAAGVGCAVARDALAGIARSKNRISPFAEDSLTEDYELGLGIAALGGKCRFMRFRGDDGQLVATRAYFPNRIEHVVRQKTRWLHGIALQGWDRLGWTLQPAEIWMRLRDRRGPLAALVLLSGYTLLALSMILLGASLMGYSQPIEIGGHVEFILLLNLFALIWRICFRFAFTMREWGVVEGIMAIARLPIANVIAIMSGRRALAAYIRNLMGQNIIWEKTPHYLHPAQSSVPYSPAPAQIEGQMV